MNNLNDLEKELLQAIIEDNKQDYPYLVSRLEILKVKMREYTGVGSFTHFEYSESQKSSKDAVLSSTKSLMIQGLENPLSFEINLTKGKIDFLEVVTNGDEKWDGKAEIFRLEDD